MNDSKILFYTEDVRYTLRDKNRIRNWINASITNEQLSSGSINIILCSDAYLHKINNEYLNHDTFTDIVTFDFSEKEDVISGDLFISIERISENAHQYNVSKRNELLRVIIHGILHLIGYNDKTQKEIATMRAKEDYYLSLLPEFFR